ncbi:MAG: FecR domain-containing protein [Pseudomonadales bacterium]
MKDFEDDDAMQELFDQAEPRLQPSSERMKAAKADFMGAFDDQQQVVPDKNTFWRNSGMAAAVLLSVLASWFALQSDEVENEVATTLVTIESIEGEVNVNGNRLQATASGQLIEYGSNIDTGSRGFIRIQLANKASLRIDSNSRITLHDQQLDLHTGRVYFDAPGVNDSITVHAGDISVRDIGTQFEVQRESDSVTVGVREGEVLVSGANRTVSAKADAERAPIVEINQGVVGEANHVSPRDERWNWIHKAPVDMALETVHGFAQIAARETGLSLEYASDAVRQASQSTRLSGKILIDDTLEQRIQEILLAASFQRLESSQHTLRIDFIR